MSDEEWETEADHVAEPDSKGNRGVDVPNPFTENETHRRLSLEAAQGKFGSGKFDAQAKAAEEKAAAEAEAARLAAEAKAAEEKAAAEAERKAAKLAAMQAKMDDASRRRQNT